MVLGSPTLIPSAIGPLAVIFNAALIPRAGTSTFSSTSTFSAADV